MMREAEYSEAAVEVLDILNHTEKEDVAKIPQSFIKFLTDISNKSYKVRFNHDQPITGLNLRKHTKELLGFIYITWWANSEEREKYKKQIHNENVKSEEIIGSYSVDDILKNKKEEKLQKIVQNEGWVETSIAEYKEVSLFRKFFNKILSFFGIKKERSLNQNDK